MWLIDFILEMEFIGALGFASVFLLIFLAIILTIYIHIMYPFLSKRLDPILFHSPWFSDAELVMYTAWPLSHVRVMQYMYFISFPNFLRKRRFKGMNSELNLPLSLVLASKVYMALHFFGVLLGLIFVVTGFYTYFFYDAPPS